VDRLLVIIWLQILNHEMELSKTKKQSSGKKKGYTLIEILVSLSVIGIIFTFGYVSYRDFSRRQALADAAKLIQGDLRFAQQNALSGQKPDGCGSNTTLESYGFDVISQNGYSIEANCGSSPISVKDVTMPAGIALSVPSPNPLEFKVLGEGTNVGASDWELNIYQTGTELPAVVRVTSSGEIK
jgi:prepilin-type N-terminal cleavage/methylation domain-containing protein